MRFLPRFSFFAINGNCYIGDMKLKRSPAPPVIFVFIYNKVWTQAQTAMYYIRLRMIPLSTLTIIMQTTNMFLLEHMTVSITPKHVLYIFVLLQMVIFEDGGLIIFLFTTGRGVDCGTISRMSADLYRCCHELEIIRDAASALRQKLLDITDVLGRIQPI